jgi:hypothetical protein
MSSPDINYPAQPSYGEGMADAMKAQMEQLLGQGDYADIYADAGFAGGNLGDILAGVEAPIRQQTAQIDTDVLRQTLLGSQQKVVQDPETGKFGIPGAEPVTGDDGEPQTAGGGRYQIIMTSSGGLSETGPGTKPKLRFATGASYSILDTKTGGLTETIEGKRERYTGDGQAKINELNTVALPELSEKFTKLQNTIEESGGDVDAPAREFEFTNPNTGQLLQEGEVVRAEDGMVDLLGDKRQVQETRKLSLSEQGEALIDQNPELSALYEKAQRDGNESNPYFGLDKSEAGRKLLEDYGGTEGIAEQFGIESVSLPTVAAMDAGRQAGFDAQGNFLGLSALAEDVQAGNLSRQRERDLADVERLSGRFQDVMEDYKPGTAEAVTGARDVLESQRQNLTGQRAATAADVEAGNATEVGEMISTGRGLVTVPTDDTYGGAATPATMAAATLGVGPTLDAKTSFGSATVADPSAFTTDTQFGGQLVDGGTDTLRSKLLSDAGSALDSELTEREKNRISEAFKARSTMMGRTFDQSAGITEAEARVAEDRARQAQNRAFAQSVLGQEAGLQQGDITRAMAQESEQAGLQQRADLADAQFLQQARAAGMQAGLQQDAQQAGIDQERVVLQAQLNQQKLGFDAEAKQQAALADQRQQQQANQFGVGAEMDAERLNAQLAQSGALGYVDAATRLASLEDQTTMDPFAALLNRAGGGSLQAGQGVFGQAGYGLSSGPQYLNPEAGLGYISQMAANEASMYGAQLAADAASGSGLMQGLGAIGGGFLSNSNLFK